MGENTGLILFWDAINGPVTRTVAEVEVDDIPGALLFAVIGPLIFIVLAAVEEMHEVPPIVETLPVILIVLA